MTRLPAAAEVATITGDLVLVEVACWVERAWDRNGADQHMTKTRPLRLDDGRTCYLTPVRQRDTRVESTWQDEPVRFDCANAPHHILSLPESWADVPDALLRGWVERALRLLAGENVL